MDKETTIDPYVDFYDPYAEERRKFPTPTRKKPRHVELFQTPIPRDKHPNATNFV